MGGHQGTVTPVGHTLGTDAVCCGTQPHTTFCLEGIRQEGRGPGKARSRMAIPVLRCQVLVRWGRGLSSAQKLSRALLQAFLLLPSEVCAWPGYPLPVPYLHANP